MKYTLLFLFISFLFFRCEKDNSAEELSCGTVFCSKQGSKEFLDLKEKPINTETLKFKLNFCWFGEFQNIEKKELKNRLTQLSNKINEDFYGANIKFEKSEIKYYNDSILIEDAHANQKDKKLQNKYGDKKQINIFIVDTKGKRLNGYTAIYKEKFKNYSRNKLNLILITKKSLQNESTIMHELGHFFGLQHTFGGNKESFTSNELADMSNCETSGDFICDTSADPNLKFSDYDCAQMKPYEFEGKTYHPPVTNYMSYYSACREMFSDDQLALMNKFANKYRKYLDCK